MLIHLLLPFLTDYNCYPEPPLQYTCFHMNIYHGVPIVQRSVFHDEGNSPRHPLNGEVIINMAFLVVYHANTFMWVPRVLEPLTAICMLIV